MSLAIRPITDILVYRGSTKERIGILFFLIAIAGIGLIIFVHEFGHFMAGKLMGLKVKEFMFGLPGPKLFSFRRGETEYGATMIPFGGYVKFAGTESELQLEEDDEDKDTPPERKYDAQPRWKKAIIMVAGPLMNLLFPVLLIALILMVQGQQHLRPVVGEVVKGSPAQEVGFKVGDRITSINGDEVDTWTDMVGHLQGNAGEQVTITIDRDSKTVTLRPTLESRDGRGFLGVAPSEKAGTVTKRELPHLALYHGVTTTYEMTRFMVVTLYQVIAHDAGELAKSSRGIIGIVDETAKVARQSISQYVFILAFLSINLGILNLLPIPPLDGGRLAILGIEGIKRSPINKKLVFAINAAGMAMLLLLMAYLVIADIGRIFTRVIGAGGG